MRRTSFENSRISVLGGVRSAEMPLVELWILRLLVKGGAWRYVDLEDPDYAVPAASRLLKPVADFMDSCRDLHERAEAAADEMTGRKRPCERGSAVGDWLAHARECGVLRERDDGGVPKALADALEAAEAAFRDRPPYDEPLAGNVGRLKKLFDLDDETAAACVFIISVLGSRGLLYWIVRRFDCSGGMKFIAALCACATGIPEGTAERLFTSEDSALRFFLKMEKGTCSSEDLDDWISRSDVPFSIQRFLHEPVSGEDLQSDFFTEAPEGTLSLSDFSHLPQVEHTVLPYLRSVLAGRKAGVNVLIHGAPGSGKTELARVIGRELRCRTCEVSVRSQERSRLAAFRAAGRCLRGRNDVILVLDEAEDVFNAELTPSFPDGPLRSNKAEINKALETNPCPALWLTNSLRGMDPAMLRRFDVILESVAPTEAQRRVLIDRAVGDVFSGGLRARLAATANLTPGVITRAKDVVEALGLPQAERDGRALELIGEVLRAQHAGTIAPAPSVLKDVYSPDCVNTDADLAALAEGLRAHPCARLCLYGVPGTGKSACAAWIARTLGRPLLRKKASDLLGCYVGETEAAIAAAFAEAGREDAVLLVDEADSFLQDRTRSTHGWETTQVNEMLTQMEAFEGLFIATTNLLDTMDPASLRRFDLKVCFDALRPEQGVRLFRRWAEGLGLDVTDAAVSRVARLDGLTPGDFAAVVRQARFRPLASSADLAERLGAELALRPGGRSRPIGFA